jgi:hypothetical protein
MCKSVLPPPAPIELVRYQIVSRYINNQTDESWEQMLEEIRLLEATKDDGTS